MQHPLHEELQFQRMLSLQFNSMVNHWEYQMRKLQCREHMKMLSWRKFEISHQ